MPLKLANNAVSRLSASLTAAATTMSVMPGDGAKFPALAADDWFPLTLVKSDGSLEIVRCTARSSDTFTITRAQEGTAALAFSAGDRVELRLTKGAIDEIAENATDALNLANSIYANTINKHLNLSDLPSIPAARENLGLGTAALDNSVADFYDNTPGRVLKVGSFGLGSQALQKTLFLGDISKSGFHHTDGNTVGLYDIGGLSFYTISLSLSPDVCLNIGTPYQKSTEDFGFRKYTDGSWDTWRWFLHTGNTTDFGRSLVQSTNNAEEAKSLLGITQNIGIGAGQTWQNMTGSRSAGVTYTNDTGRSIFVNIGVGQSNGASLQVTVNSVLVAQYTTNSSWAQGKTVSFVVPSNATYAVAGFFDLWAELR